MNFKSVIDYFFVKLREFAAWAKEMFKKEKPPVEVVPFPTPVNPPVPVEPRPVEPTPPVVVVPAPVDPIPVTPEVPVEEPPRGYNGYPQSNMVFDNSQPGKHEYVWMEDGQARSFTITVPPSGRYTVGVQTTPRMGYATLQEAQQVDGWVVDSNSNVVHATLRMDVTSGRWLVYGTPGDTHHFNFLPVGYTGGSIWQLF